jgi:predicted phage terminase large subunit-like protein
MNLTLQQIQRERLKRSFHLFAKESFKVLHNGQKLIDNWHIKYLCDVLQQEAERIVSHQKRNKHLLINVPPRTLKSELVNVFFSIYLWTLDDSIQFISSSYSSTLSIALSVQARRLILSDWFKNHFPNIKLSVDEKQKTKFSTPNNGLRYATSTGGSITGMGGDVIVIDDPQNPQHARSDKERDNANTFFNETLRSRLNDPEKGMFIVIMQRLHENDLTGMLLELEPNEWEHICLPAEYSENVKPAHLKDFYINGLLFPQRLNYSVLNGFKIGLGSYGYSGQYSQTPSPADGGILKRDWFILRDSIINSKGVVVPYENLVWNFVLDTAYTEKQTNDPTALLAYTYFENNLYIRRVESVWKEFPALCKYIPEFTANYGYTHSSRIKIEPKASGKSVKQQLKQTTGLNVIEDKPPTQDKVSRANAISPFVEAGRCILLEGSWVDSFLNQCASFPNGTHDDEVDCLVMAIENETTRKKQIKAFA